LDTVYEVDQNIGCHEGEFLFENVVSLRVMSSEIANKYLRRYKNLQELDLARMEFDNFRMVEALTYNLPKRLLNITVLNDTVKELFKLGAHVHKRTFSV
jgi:hypothetical protein